MLIFEQKRQISVLQQFCASAEMACATTIGLPAVSDDIDSSDAEFTVWDGIGQSNLMGFGTQVINGKSPLADLAFRQRSAHWVRC